jgi:thiosulfate reductase cytochrome b subunit
MREVREDDFDEDYGVDDESVPYWFPGTRLPEEARRIGLTHHVPDGALLDFASRLDSSRAYHRVVAWIMLVVFGLPVVFYVIRLVQDLGVH